MSNRHLTVGRGTVANSGSVKKAECRYSRRVGLVRSAPCAMLSVMVIAGVGRCRRMPWPASATVEVVTMVVTFVSEIGSLSLTLEPSRT